MLFTVGRYMYALLDRLDAALCAFCNHNDIHFVAENVMYGLGLFFVVITESTMFTKF